MLHIELFHYLAARNLKRKKRLCNKKSPHLQKRSYILSHTPIILKNAYFTTAQGSSMDHAFSNRVPSTFTIPFLSHILTNCRYAQQTRNQPTKKKTTQTFSPLRFSVLVIFQLLSFC